MCYTVYSVHCAPCRNLEVYSSLNALKKKGIVTLESRGKPNLWKVQHAKVDQEAGQQHTKVDQEAGQQHTKVDQEAGQEPVGGVELQQVDI